MLTWLNNPANMLLALVVAVLLVGLARLPRFFDWIQQQSWLMDNGGAVLRLVRARRAPAPPPPREVAATLPGAGTALRHPPGMEQTIAHMRQRSPGDRYLLPLGWWGTGADRPDLAYTALVGETNHLLITGASDSGKDNLAWWMLLALALVHRTPRALQVAIIDGKGLDFQPWASKAHTWRLATESEQIPDALRALSAERRRRRQILERAGVSKWDQYTGDDLPLLVVFISELSLVETALRRERQRRERDRAQDLALDSWLNDELTSGRAFGIRYLIAMQSVTGMDMLWRSQITTVLAGYQPDETQVRPNTTKTAKQLVELGAVPPHQLPSPPVGAGVFTVVSGDEAATVRAPLLRDDERRRWLAQLPDRAPDHEALLADLFATPTPPKPAMQPRLAPVAAAVTLQNAPEMFAGDERGFSASETGFAFSELGLSPVDLAEIGARLARGETKTEIVRQMPGYTTRQHRQFAAYYDTVHKALHERLVAQ